MSRRNIKVGAIIGLVAPACVTMAAQTPMPPNVGVGQAFKVADDFKLSGSTKMTGTGLAYQLPAPYQSEFVQTISRTISLAALDSNGLPLQFTIKYDTIAAANASSGVEQPLVGRTVEAHVITGTNLDISAGDGNSLSDRDRSFVSSDAHKFIEYLSAAARFSAVKYSTTDYQEVSAQVIASLIGLDKIQVKNTFVKQQAGPTTPTFNLKMVVVAAQSEGGGDLPVSGTMTIQKDWSSFEVVVKNRNTRTSGSEKDKIQVVVDTSWFFDLSRKMVKH